MKMNVGNQILYPETLDQRYEIGSKEINFSGNKKEEKIS